MQPQFDVGVLSAASVVGQQFVGPPLAALDASVPPLIPVVTGHPAVALVALGDNLVRGAAEGRRS